MWRRSAISDRSISNPGPKFDPELARDEVVTVVVQVNGKVRDKLQVAADTAETDVRAMALKSEAVMRHLDGKTPKKVIYVPQQAAEHRGLIRCCIPNELCR